MATGNLGSPSRVRCKPMTSVSFNSLTVSPPAPALRLGEVGGVGSLAKRLGTGVRGLLAFSVLESPAYRCRASERLTVMSNRLQSALVVSRRCPNCLKWSRAAWCRLRPSFTVPVLGGFRPCPESDEREARSTWT